MSEDNKPQTTIDAGQFSVNERADEYEVTFRFVGTVRETIHAASREEATSKAEEMMKSEDFDTQIDEPEEVEISYLRKASPMYRVTRDGRTMQVSVLREGDIPRMPDPHSGF